MPQVCHDSDRPFIFSYGGRPYIIPPSHGGKWKVVYERQRDKNGKMQTRTLAKKTGDSKRTYIDIPDEAWRQLQDGEHISRHKGKVRILKDVQTQMEAEMEELRRQKEQLLADQQEFSARLAIASSEETKPKKRTRG
tara:strand:+ start:2205 stop:2615 length:411 start_codon:yes stop_codon:yes gene_type:complete